MSTLTVNAKSSVGGSELGCSTLSGFDNTYSTAQDGAGVTGSQAFGIEVGQDNQGTPTYHIYRNGLAFDTSALTVGATITAAILSVYGFANYSDTDFNLTVVSGTDLADSMVDGDYQDLLTATTSFGATSTASFVEGAYFDITLNATGIAAISKTGTTRFGLRSSRDISATTPTGFESIQFESAWIDGWPATHRPKLTITYYGSLSAGNIAWSGNYLVGIDHNGNRRQILGDIY